MSQSHVSYTNEKYCHMQATFGGPAGENQTFSNYLPCMVQGDSGILQHFPLDVYTNVTYV